MSRRRLHPALLTLVLAPVAAYAIICGIAFFRQDSLLFHPRHAAEADLVAQARAAGFAPWINAAGERIGWRSEAGDPENVFLILHGNGGHAFEDHHRRLHAPIDRAAFRIYLLEYPGFGSRDGKPSARALVDSALEAVDLLAASPGRRIWLLGQSMGTGVACAVAAARSDRTSGVVLVTPYNSLAAGAAYHHPWLPVRLLLRHRLDSDQNLTRYDGPVAFLIAGRDGTVPPELGRTLYDGYAGPKRLWLAPEAGHNDLDALLADWPEIIGWLTRESKIP